MEDCGYVRITVRASVADERGSDDVGRMGRRRDLRSGGRENSGDTFAVLKLQLGDERQHREHFHTVHSDCRAVIYSTSGQAWHA